MIDQFDEKKTHCRQLGHLVPFGYCRLVSDKLPCKQVFNCWFEIFPVKEFMINNYTDEEIRTILTPTPSRLDTILGIAEKIYQQNKKTD